MNMLNLTRLPLMRWLPFLVFLPLLLALAACGGDAVDAEEGAMQTTPPTGGGTYEMPDSTMMAEDEMDHGDMDGMADDAASARMVDGVQVVEVEAGRMGYQPRAIALEEGAPARLVFTRIVDSECASQVSIPDFDVPETDLPMNQPVAIEFMPTASGTFTFVCGMDMQRGSIMVRA